MPFPFRISGYNGSGVQIVSRKITARLSVNASDGHTVFSDPSAPLAIADLGPRDYQLIVGWHYIQDKNIAVDGSEPCLRFPRTPPCGNAKPCAPEDPLPEQLPQIQVPAPTSETTRPSTVRAMDLRKFKRLVKRTAGRGLGAAVIFNEPDPEAVISRVARPLPISAISQSDTGTHHAAKGNAEIDPRTKLPPEYHDFIDLCNP